MGLATHLRADRPIDCVIEHRSTAPSAPETKGTPLSWRALGCAALVTMTVYLGFVLAWRSDRSAIISPADSLITTSVRADLYALLAAGFLKGQLSLDLAPPPELVAAKNPYDPAQRPRVLYLHDASLYQGRYYIYFGPTPAVLLFAPWRLVTGRDLPSPYAVFVFVSLAYVGLLTIFAGIVRTHFPAASRLAQWAGVIALGGATMLVPLVRRPGVYEVAIACGCACMAWGLYCAWRARFSTRPVAWATGCGVLFGLAVAARPTFGVGALAAVLIMNLDPLTHRLRLRVERRLLAAAAAGAVLVAALLVYNYARFAEPLQFGQKYQLSAAEEGAIQHFSPRFVPPQAWFYLVAPLRLGEYFPFIREVNLPHYPAGFAGREFSFGVFPNLPITGFALVALFFAWRGTAARGLALAFLIGSVAALLPLLFYFGSCVRYQAEFTPALMLLSLVGVFEAERAAGVRRRLVGAVALGLATMSAVVALLASVDMYSASENVPPRGFDPIGRFLNQPTMAWRKARGEVHGPIELTLRLRQTAEHHRQHLIHTTGPSGAGESLAIEWAAPGKLRVVALRVGPEPFEYSAVVDAPAGATHQLTASLSSFYPIRAIELPGVVRPEDFRALKIWVRVSWNGRTVIEEPVPLGRWRATHAHVAGPGGTSPAPANSIAEILAQHRGMLPSATRPRIVGGVRLNVTFEPDQVGRSFPLGVTGHHGRGNFLFVKVAAPGLIQFGYDHWGKPVLYSPPVPVTMGPRHTIEFWMPSILSLDEASPVIIRLDGASAWTATVPFYPAGAAEIFVVRNPLGGSSCERDLPGVVIEDLQLPRP